MPLNEEESKRVQELHDALKQEFLADEGTPKSAIQDITELKEDALLTLKYIVKHSQSETLKAKVAMWAYEQILEAEGGSTDPLKKLLEGMPKPDNVPSNS